MSSASESAGIPSPGSVSIINSMLPADSRPASIDFPVEPVSEEVFEEIAVTANPGEENFAPVSVAISVVDPRELPVPPTTLMEVGSATPIA